MSSRHVSSCDVTLAVGMWEAIYHWILPRRFTLLSLCLRHVISCASTPHTFLLSHTFREVSARDVRIVCPRPNTTLLLLLTAVPMSWWYDASQGDELHRNNLASVHEHW